MAHPGVALEEIAAELRRLRELLISASAALATLDLRLRERGLSRTQDEGVERRPVSINRAAKRLGLCRSTLAEAVASGKVASVPWGAKRVRIPMREILRLEAEGFGPVPRRRRKPTRAHSRVRENFDEELARHRSMTLDQALEAARRRRDSQRQ